MSEQRVNSITVTNHGAFIVKDAQIWWKDPQGATNMSTWKSKEFSNGTQVTAESTDLTEIPDGTNVGVYCNVVWGTHAYNPDSQMVVKDSTANGNATYDCTGGADTPKVALNGG